MHRRGQVALDQPRRFRSITGGEFVGRVIETMRAGPHPAVVVEVAGEAFFTGTATFGREPGDPLGEGFLLRR
jgi:trans-L-3-hydroxyproline dehydratase